MVTFFYLTIFRPLWNEPAWKTGSNSNSSRLRPNEEYSPGLYDDHGGDQPIYDDEGYDPHPEYDRNDYQNPNNYIDQGILVVSYL